MSRNQAFCVSVLLLAVALNLAGCSSSSSPKPVTALELSVDSTACEVCNTVRVTATVHGGDSKAVDWYVNGAFGGQVTTGTVTQTNPTTFTAPEAVPVEPVVQIKAVSQEEPSIADSCVVRIAFTTIHVNAASGNDQTGTGCITHPLKTITHALAAAQPNMTVLVAPGTYDATNGETFPLEMTGRITLLGESQAGTIIRTHANVYCALIMNGDSPRVRRLTIDNGGIADTTREHVIYVNGDATGAGIDSLIIPDRAYLSMIRVAAATNTAITNCQFIAQGTVKSRCFEIVFGDSGTIIRNCLISGFIEGIFFNGSELRGSDALVEGCTIENNWYGIDTCCFNSDTSNPHPDLGGGPRGSLGGNVIRDNEMFGLWNVTKSTIYAKYNTWGHTPPTVGSATGSDIYNQGTGSVVWE